MKNRKILLLLTLFLVCNVLAYNTEECINFRTENLADECKDVTCIAVELEIIPADITDFLVVDDRFHYKITLHNPKETPIPPTIFKVSIFNPKNISLGIREYPNISIGGKENRTLFPKKAETTYDVFPVDTQGTYKITINSNNSMVFYRFYPQCNYVFYNDKYTFYRDAMPRWQYEWNDLLREWQEESKKVSKETMSLTKNIENLTMSLIMLTFILIIIELWPSVVKYRHIILGLEGIVIFLVFIFYSPYDINQLSFPKYVYVLLVTIFIALPSLLLLKKKVRDILPTLIILLFISFISMLNFILFWSLISELHRKSIENTFMLLCIIVSFLSAILIYFKDFLTQGKNSYWEDNY